MANNNELPSVRRSCGDCVYCRGYISLWCKNPEAVKARGTAIPGIYHCPYWNRSRWYDNGWLEIPEQPHRVLRLIRLFPYLIKRKINKNMAAQTNKEYQLLSTASNISELKEKIATLSDTLNLKKCCYERRYDGVIEIFILIEDELTAKVMEDNEKKNITRQCFVWGVFFLVSSILLFPIYIVGFSREKLYNGDTETILSTCMMGLFIFITFLCFSIGIYRKFKIRRKED